MLCLGEIKTRGNHLQLKKGEYNMSENNPVYSISNHLFHIVKVHYR